MKKIFSPTSLLLAALAITAIALAIFWLRQPGATLAPKPETTEGTGKKNGVADYARLFEKSIDCAALMAAMESAAKGRLEPESPMFNLIGYTLGHAQEQAQKGGLDPASVRPAYDLKVIAYYQKFIRDPEAARSHHLQAFEECVATARHYDPHTMIQAAMEDHRQSSPRRVPESSEKPSGSK